MRINIMEVEDARVFDYLVAPEQNPMNQAYLSQVYQDNIANVNNILTEHAQSFMAQTRELFSAANNSRLAKEARSIIRRVGTFFNPNSVYALLSVEDIRCAQPVMQRYIMAEPTLRARYHEQTIDGYSQTYIDNNPKDIGDSHYDYRRVMQGMMVEDEEHGWYSKTYADDLFDGDRELELEEKADILTTWEVARNLLYNKQDPTDIFA